MVTLYQTFVEHLKKHGCSFFEASDGGDDTEVWKTEKGTYFCVPKHCCAKSNVNNIAASIGIPPLNYEQH